MSPRAPIIAGKTVIVVQVQDTIDRSLETIRTKFRKFGTSIGNLSLDLFRGGLFGSLPLGFLTKEFKDFEDKILFLSTKLTASEKDFKLLTTRIRDLGKSTSFTASEVADAATILAQAGLNAKEVMNTLQPTLDLARGAQITLSQSGEILANTMRSFGMETSNANVVASQFIAAARLGTLDVLDLKESIKEVLGTVRNLNIDLPTTLALLTQMASRSLKGTKAGTSLNTALLQLASKKDTIAKSLNIHLGEDINGDQFINFLEQLYQKLSKMGNLSRTATLQRIFNIRGARAITALDEIKAIIDLRKQIAEAGNEARNAAVKMDSGFGGSLRRATSAVNDLSISLGKLLAGPLGKFLEQVPQIAIGIEALTEQAPQLTLTLLAIPPAMLVVGAAGLTLSFALGKLAGLAGTLLGVFRPLGSFLNSVLTVNLINAYRASNKLGKGFKGIDTGLSAMLLTPEIYRRGKKKGTVKPTSFFGRTGKMSLSGLGARAATNLTKVEQKLLSIQKTATRKAGLNILGILGGGKTGRAGLSILSGLNKVGSGATKGFFSALRTITKVDYVKILFNIFTTTGRVALGFLRAAGSVAKFVFSFNGLVTILQMLLIFGPKIEFISKAFTRLGNGVKNAFSEIGKAFGLIAGGPAGLFAAGFGQIFSGKATEGINSISESLSKMSDIIGSQLSAAWNTFVEAIAPAYDFMRKLISSTIELGKLLVSTFGTAAAQLGNTFKLAGSSSGEVGSGIAGLFASAFDPENIKTAFVGIGAVITGMATTVTSGINKMVTIVVDTMIMLQERMLALSGENPMLQGVLGSIPGVGNLIGNSGDLGNRLKGNRELSANLKDDLQKSLDNIQTQFEKFTKNLDNVFNIDTEKQSRAKKWIAIQNAMADEWLASIELTGEGLTDVVDQIRHAGLFPKTSIFASRFAGNANIIQNAGPLSPFAAHAAGLAPGRVGKPIPVVAVAPNGAAQAPNFIPATIKQQLEESQNRLDEAINGKFEGVNIKGMFTKGPSLEELQAKYDIAKMNPALQWNTDLTSNGEKERAKEQLESAREALQHRKARVNWERKNIVYLQRQQRLQERMEKMAARGLAPQLRQMGDIRDVVAATVGDIQSSRFNKFKAIGKDVQQDQLDTLNNIAAGLGTGGGQADPFLKQLLSKAQPLVLQ